MTLIFLAASKPLEDDVELGRLGRRGRAAAASRRSRGHHHRAAGGRFDAVLVLELVLQLDRLGDGQAGELSPSSATDAMISVHGQSSFRNESVCAG